MRTQTDLETLRSALRPTTLVIVVLLAAALWGQQATDLTVPAAGVDAPVVDLLLVLAAGWAALILARRVRGVGRAETAVIASTALAALFGAALLAFRSEGATQTRFEEAVIFVYPLLFALPLVADRDWVVRAVRGTTWPWVALALGVFVTGIGFRNMIEGSVELTSTGHDRYLGGIASPVLMLGLLAGFLLLTRRAPRLPVYLAMVACLTGFLLVQHRSSYLSLALAGVVFAVLILSAASVPARRELLRHAAIVAVLFAPALATPLGTDAIDRMRSAADTSDPNIAFRLDTFGDVASGEEADPTAEVTGAAGQASRRQNRWLIGVGVGRGGIYYEAPNGQVLLREIHQSYAAAWYWGGALGLIVLLIPLVLLSALALRAHRDPASIALLSVAAFTFVMAFFNVVFERSYFGVWVWVPLLAAACVGLALSEGRSDRPSPAVPPPPDPGGALNERGAA